MRHWHILVAALLPLFTPLLPANAEDSASVLAFAALQHDHVAEVQRFNGSGCDVERADDERDASREIEAPIRIAVTCFKSGERTSGMYKICYYDCLGSTVAITIDATQLCPLTINR